MMMIIQRKRIGTYRLTTKYEALGYTYKQNYWTSSGDNGWYKDAYITQIGVDESADNWQRDKNLHHRAMYMVHFE